MKQGKTLQKSQQKFSHQALFDGGISEHHAHVHQNEPHVIVFLFWIGEAQLHFVGSEKREKRQRNNVTDSTEFVLKLFKYPLSQSNDSFITCKGPGFSGICCCNP